MKRILYSLLFSFVFALLLSGCDLLEGIELAPPEDPAADTSEADTGGGEAPEEEPEGSKAVTLLFAEEMDEERTVLLEAAQAAAEEAGYTLSTVTSLGDPELQSRFLKMASAAGEQAILIELTDPAEAESALEDAGAMSVVFVGAQPEAGLGKSAIYVGNPEGAGDLYLRMTGSVAMRAAANLIEGNSVSEGTDLKVSGHKIIVPADGVIAENS